MGVFAGYASNRAQPLADTYTNTAQQISMGCGPNFVDATVPVGVVSSNAVSVNISVSKLAVLVMGVLIAAGLI